MNLPPYIEPGDKVVLFDGVCRLCNGWSKFLIRHDRREVFKLCSVQSAEGQAILEFFGLPTETFDTMLLIDAGTAYKQSDAFIQVIRHLPRPWRFLALARLVPKPIRDWLYDRVAFNRYRLFGRYDQCLIPSADTQRRFLGQR
jgi:predicted DCC family thiol-disulfide oxidoreductase YuxK